MRQAAATIGEAESTVAERITAANAPQRAEEAGTSGDDSPAGPAERPTANSERSSGTSEALNGLHSGHKLAKRYRLEECITRLDGFISWRAVDEKLRRAVGVHVLPADHTRATSVLDAARSAALLGDPRFVQVLDADQHGALVHVIHEWLPDAVPLSTLLQAGPLAAHDAYDLVSEVSRAMAAAHGKGLAHLRLTPGTVLRTGAGPFRIRGLAVDAALRGIEHEHPQRADTEATGALLYAALTQRWPYHDGGYGLLGVAGLGRGTRDSLATPEQVRAGVHRGLSDLAMRALINDGATAASEKPPCVTAEDVVKALATLPRIRPPESAPELLAGYQRTTYQQGSYGAGPRPPARRTTVAATAPPALPGRAGAALKWGVSALLIAALGLGSWQIADALMESDTSSPPDVPAQPVGRDDDDSGPSETPVAVVEIHDFDPHGGTQTENPEATPYAIDNDPETFWHTENYYGPGFGNLKPGLGLILDLGETHQVSSVTVDAMGEHSVQLLAAPSSADAMPTDFADFSMINEATGDSLTLNAEEAVESRYLLVWLTELPQGEDGNYRGRISNISVTS
jgi:hypothetical protein